MREIKFRVYDPITEELTKPLNIGGTSVALCMYPNAVVQQYTGLKDKNGKEIYEGDIIIDSVFEPNQFDHQIVDEYVFNILDKIRLCYNPKGERSKYIEVIGNIYENPELLK